MAEKERETPDIGLLHHPSKPLLTACCEIAKSRTGPTPDYPRLCGRLRCGECIFHHSGKYMDDDRALRWLLGTLEVNLRKLGESK